MSSISCPPKTHPQNRCPPPLVIRTGHAKGNYPHLTLLKALTGTSQESTRRRLLYYTN